ncbi:MAG: RluA family pseudouridine synthase [Planctomycetes bacterium]|nr:RluA family pseudouridine synthase [Planctomycetota bacterium]
MSTPVDQITLRTKVPADQAGRTLLEFLVGRFRYHDEAGWRARIADGRITVNGLRTIPTHRLARAAVVAYVRPAAEPDAPTDVRILHDDDGIVAIDKPAGLPFHADGAFLTRTVVGVLAGVLGVKLRPVQRLDRETSGVCVLARDATTARALNEQIAAHGFDKVYEAIVRGVIAADRLELDGAIGRDPHSEISIRRAVLPSDAIGAEPAHTDVEVLARCADRTLVRCRPRTGRTHQIRVHLAHAGHPVLGDKLYGRTDAEFLAFVAHVKAGGDAAFGNRCGAPRHMLHARWLSFTDPRTGRRLRFEAEPPADFLAAGPSDPYRV